MTTWVNEGLCGQRATKMVVYPPGMPIPYCEAHFPTDNLLPVLQRREGTDEWYLLSPPSS
jgi:hypothetical protein